MGSNLCTVEFCSLSGLGPQHAKHTLEFYQPKITLDISKWNDPQGLKGLMTEKSFSELTYAFKKIEKKKCSITNQFCHSVQRAQWRGRRVKCWGRTSLTVKWPWSYSAQPDSLAAIYYPRPPPKPQELECPGDCQQASLNGRGYIFLLLSFYHLTHEATLEIAEETKRPGTWTLKLPSQPWTPHLWTCPQSTERQNVLIAVQRENLAYKHWAWP